MSQPTPDQNRPLLSPVGSDWSGISRYQSFQPEGNSPGGPNQGPGGGPPDMNGNGPPPRSASVASNGRRPSLTSLNGGNGPPIPSLDFNGGPFPGNGPMMPFLPSTISLPNGPLPRNDGISTPRSSNGMYPPGDGSLQGLVFEETVSLRYFTLKRLLGSYLETVANERANKPNAQDKLQKLSQSQFAELSEDIHDEMCRREGIPDPAAAEGFEMPSYLPPKDTFYYKRNQARMRLSTLTPERFKILATDIYFELERRFPGFTRDAPGPPPMRGGSPTGSVRSMGGMGMRGPGGPGGFQGPPRMGSPGPGRMNSPGPGGIPRIGSPGPGRMGSPGPGMMRGPGGPGGGYNGGPGGPGGQYPIRTVGPGMGPPGSMAGPGSPRGPPPGQGGPGGPGGPPNALGRPLPKTFQNNTIIPNISTMVEEDDDGFDEDAYGPGQMSNRGSLAGKRESTRSRSSLRSIQENPTAVTSEADKKVIADYQSQVQSLNDKIKELENELEKKQEELKSNKSDDNDRENANEDEKREWQDMRLALEEKLIDAQTLNSSLQNEIAKVKADKENAQRDMEFQIDEERASFEDRIKRLQQENQELASAAPSNNVARSSSVNGGAEVDELLARNQQLEQELREQEEVTEEVRKEAMEFLDQMKQLSQDSEQAWKREEELMDKIKKLQDENADWRSRYAKVKSQIRSIRAMSIGLPLQPQPGLLTNNSELADPHGLVRDVDVTKYQIAIDDLLRAGRGAEPASVLNYMKAVIRSVQGITQGMEGSATNSPAEANSTEETRIRLKTRVSATANNLITASKNHATANGLSPVSLLDAAASHLTTEVVELIKLVKAMVETEFEHIVTSIQSLLSLIRTPTSTLPSITKQISSISSIVGKVLLSTESTMSQTGNSTLRERADHIVHNLGDCRAKMIDMGKEASAEGEYGGMGGGVVTAKEVKEYKTRLAGLAFAMAREIKELVRVVEEVDAEVANQGHHHQGQGGYYVEGDDEDFR